MVRVTSSHFTRIINATLEHTSFLLLARYGLYDSKSLYGVLTKMAVSCAAALLVMYSIEGRVADDTAFLVPFTVGLLILLSLKVLPAVLRYARTNDVPV